MKICTACHSRFGGESWHCPQCGHLPPSRGSFVSFDNRVLVEDKTYASKESVGELARLEADHAWFISRARLICWALREFFPQAGNLFEVGCGTGFVLQAIKARFPKLALTGGEPSLAALDHAHARVPDAKLLHLRAEVIPFDSEFDVVGAFDVLEHIPEDSLALSQMLQATRPGGGMLLTVPQHPFLWSPFDEYSGHHRRYTRHALVDVVSRAGWEILCVTSFVFLLLPAIAISRKLFQSDFSADPLRELRISRVSNCLFGITLAAERMLIRCGVRFPVGSSLLLVARRPRGSS